MRGPWRSWSLRTRLMVIGLLGVAVAQAIGSVALAAALHVTTERRVERSSRATADEVAALARAGRLPQTLSASGIEIVQVLDDRGRVVSASQNADRLTALLDPAEVDRATHHPVTVSGSRLALGSALRVRATAITTPDGARTVLVADPIGELVSSDEVLRRTLLITYPLLLLVLGVIAYRVIGAALRPVEELRSAADRISGSGRGDRLPVPPTDDEVRALAVTLNSMLDRVDGAREREAGFVADVAHELRNPIASMRMQVDVAMRLGDGGTLAGDLHEDVSRLSDLVDDLLALARLDAGSGSPATPVQPVAVRPALERAAALTTDGATVSIVSVEAADECEVALGATELDRVLANLVGNAARHARTVQLGATSHDHRVLITVDDDGPGIPEADRERAFERFTRLDDARDRDSGGAGLGLAIVRELVRGRGGDVRLSHSALGGLRVEVELPAPVSRPSR